MRTLWAAVSYARLGGGVRPTHGSRREVGLGCRVTVVSHWTLRDGMATPLFRDNLLFSLGIGSIWIRVNNPDCLQLEVPVSTFIFPISQHYRYKVFEIGRSLRSRFRFRSLAARISPAVPECRLANKSNRGRQRPSRKVTFNARLLCRYTVPRAIFFHDI